MRNLRDISILIESLSRASYCPFLDTLRIHNIIFFVSIKHKMSKPICNVTYNDKSYHDPNAFTGVSASSSCMVVIITACCTYMTYSGNVNAAFIMSVMIIILCLGFTIKNLINALKDETTTNCTKS